MKTIRIHKGRDIVIPGVAEKTVCTIPATGSYAVKPTDWVGVQPRLLVNEGDRVLAGSPLFEDKGNPGVPFPSPVSGTVRSIARGEKRSLQAVVVEANDTQQHLSYPICNPMESDAPTLRHRLISSGLWTLLRQRPFGTVPAPDATPKAVFISAFDSSPLPVDYDFMLRERREDFQYGVNALQRIAGNIHLSLNGRHQQDSFFTGISGADIHFFDGPHPAGLVGTHISAIDPINKGETVWTVNPQDVAIIGHLLRTGEYLPERMVAFCGPMVKNPCYLKALAGCQISVFQDCCILNNSSDRARYICGSVLSGTSVAADGFLCSSTDKVCLLPEGNRYDFLGWLRPNWHKFSFSRTFLSGFFKKNNPTSFTSHLQYDTGMHGDRRPLFVTGEFEKLVPIDILPMQLIKACIVGDIERMEELGIYEVEPEDLALCEFADTSKTEIQDIIRRGLERFR